MTESKVPRGLLIFIPTYNEADNAERLYKEIKALNISGDILFMDDNSPDGTGSILDSIACNDPAVKVLHRSGKSGIGSAHYEGIKYSYEKAYDMLVTMNCDFTHTPADILRLLDAVKGFDLAIGSRYMQSGSLPGWNPMRRFLTLFAHFMTWLCLGNRYDASGAFRIYNLKRIPKSIFESVKSQSYSFFFESLFILTRNGFSLNEIPIVLPARTYGHSKMSFFEAAKSFRYLIRLTLEDRLNPGRFHIGRPIDRLNEDLLDDQNWTPYWERKSEALGFVYEIIAAIYRRFIIRPNLERTVKQHFPFSSVLMHAGCGSGQVDVGLHEFYSIKAVDISYSALDLYSRNNPKAWRIEQDDILALRQNGNEFDGIFNLGEMEHFEREKIGKILKEFSRFLKNSGKVVIFWPHRWTVSVLLLGYCTIS